MDHLVTKNEIVHGIRKLSVAERLDIVSVIWDEIKDSQELEAMSDYDKKLLLNRLSNYRENPESAIDWDELKQVIHDRHVAKS